jgi:hypothetical protein
MTFEQCKAILSEIRRRQGTEHPLVQVNCSGTIVRGRLTRSDTDRSPVSSHHSPYGLLVLENPGLLAGPLTFVQIASIPDEGLTEFTLHADSKPEEHALVAAGRGA